jgi:hypothetical protein
LCLAQLPTSTAFRSSISGLATKRRTSTLNDIGIYYFYEYVYIDLIFCLTNKTVHLSTPTSAAIARIGISSETLRYNGCLFKFGVEVGVELSIVNALYRLRITDQLFKSYAFTRVVRSQSTLQRLLRRQILKNTLYSSNSAIW